MPNAIAAVKAAITSARKPSSALIPIRDPQVLSGTPLCFHADAPAPCTCRELRARG
ncbi:hypothetical protein GCM10011371_18940 [Novosphingobium marinum]|nr:hypothetical protein GCM10011371_18940 [Novosphingobium marinum]